MLLIWARVIILGYMAMNESNEMSYPSTIGGAVPILTIANRATSCWRLHHQQQTQAFRKMANKEQDEATFLYICDERGYGTNAMHNGAFSIALFISFRRQQQQHEYRLLRLLGDDPGKKSRACPDRSIRSFPHDG